MLINYKKKEKNNVNIKRIIIFITIYKKLVNKKY